MHALLLRELRLIAIADRAGLAAGSVTRDPSSSDSAYPFLAGHGVVQIRQYSIIGQDYKDN